MKNERDVDILERIIKYCNEKERLYFGYLLEGASRSYPQVFLYLLISFC